MHDMIRTVEHSSTIAVGKGFPGWFIRGRFIEELLGQTRFKDWLWTGSISSTFPTVDFARQVGDKFVAASVKSTTTTDVLSWMREQIANI